MLAMYSSHARALMCEVRMFYLVFHIQILGHAWAFTYKTKLSMCAHLYHTHTHMQAHKHGLRYPQQQFLIFGWYSEGWLIEPDPTKDLGCTLEERTRTLDRALAVAIIQYSTNASLVTEGGLVSVDRGM